MSAVTFHNRTRRSPSIPRKLLREGKFYLVPLYYLLLTSDLAREGVRNSGSYRFADHIYRGVPGGRYIVGYLLDALFLRMAPATAFRARYLYAKEEIHRLAASKQGVECDLEILAVPCGLARELFEAAQELKRIGRPAYDKIHWHGLDLDRELIERLSERAARRGLNMTFRRGDALDAASYPQRYDMIVSLGFGEFLDDARLVDFYRLARASLKPGGVLVTSGMQSRRFSDYLLRNIGELHTFYRSEASLRALARRAGFSEVRAYQDPTGLQTMLVLA
ncbi:MAG: methyltransferase domain-containing protein [Chloroflexia bacterium]